jgi:DNA-binding GntR family transcriptional regulator
MCHVTSNAYDVRRGRYDWRYMSTEGLELRSLRRTNLRQEAVEVLRAAILGGELAPGSIHSAVSLAELMGVSPTPVREAMLELARSGLVEVLPNRGFLVTVVDDRDLDEVAEMRKLLEIPAMGLVIARASDEQLLQLEQPLRELEAAAGRNDVAAFLLADRDFHIGLLTTTDNQRLVNIIAELRDQTRIVGLQSLAAAGALQASAAEHRPILEAIRARDVKAAKREMAAHLEHTRGAWAGRAEPAAPLAAR